MEGFSFQIMPAPSTVIRENIDAVANMEQRFRERRTPIDRIVDAIADFTGSLPFILIHLAGFVLWFLVNAGYVPPVPRFDPYPYTMLSTVVSCEAVLLSAFVLMKQNRMALRADERDHLHLQINLLAEKEVTKILQTLSTMCEHMGIRGPREDPQMEELTRNTAVDDLAEELRDKIHNVSE